MTPAILVNDPAMLVNDLEVGAVIYIRLPRHVVVLTEEETMDLLRRNPELWERGIKRGKAAIRSRVRAKREEGRKANV